MTSKNNPEEVYNYVKKHLQHFIQDGKIHLSYQLLINEIVKFDSEELECSRIEYGKLITNTINLKQDIIDTMNLKWFDQFLFYQYNSAQEFYQELYDNSELLDEDAMMKELLYNKPKK